MDRLWTPWRYQYITKSPSQGVPAEARCIFCDKASQPASPEDDEQGLVVARGSHNFVLLNLFPYTNGHLMIAPYEHVDSLSGASSQAAAEMMALARRAERVLKAVYRCPGLNLGMNLGECAGAGVAGHIHLHVLPRWPGDANFMTTVAETRILPEELSVSLGRIREGWNRDVGE